MLNVEVKGISFDNKGAELMLHAILAQFAERGVTARFVVEPNGSYERRAKLGLWQKSRYIKKRMNILRPLGWLPLFLRRVLGIINEDELDLILDASGFSYGDQWNPVVANDRLGSSVRKLRARDVPVVVLPQALGPFEKAASKRAILPILQHANLVFPRDKTSMQYCDQLVPQAKHIKQCPDFTNLIKGIPCAEFDPQQHQVCFIPNSKMIEKRKDDGRYVEFMVAAIEATLKTGGKPFALIHEAEADRRLMRTIQERLSTPIPVLDPQDALKIKWVIGQSKLVISSRFHGLVSALSQSVPVLATGWSHKYQELLGDYQCPEQLFDVDNDSAAAVASLEKLLNDPAHYEQLRARLQEAGEWQRNSVRAMWDKVFALLPVNELPTDAG